MIYNEAIEVLNSYIHSTKELNNCFPEDKDSNNKDIKAFNIAIKAIEEIKQYREIGTVEELKVLKEKSIAKKVIRLKNHDYYDYKCPTCGFSDLYCMGKKYCSCGQALEF